MEHHVPSREPSGPVASRLSTPRVRPKALVSGPPASRAPKRLRQSSLPFSFPPLFQPNTSSTSLVPSTAEGKPIPLGDGTAANRTSALREISINYPSRYRSAKSTGAQSSTYSQPVLVRTYSGGPSRPSSVTCSVHAREQTNVAARATSIISGPAASVRRAIALHTHLGGKQHDSLSMARSKSRPCHLHQDVPAKLPPVEAFTFKSIIASLENESDDDVNKIDANLDRIAEICAKSRYSLSNQYEVHVAPHGSGTAFLTTNSSKPRNRGSGPTLQAVTSDDEQGSKRQQQRRAVGNRRRSMAMGTLETIMSSSGSSEEGRAKKKSASEITEEVRGRAAKKALVNLHPSATSLPCSNDGQDDRERQPSKGKQQAKKRTPSFATVVIGTTRQVHDVANPTLPPNNVVTLISEPALPQTSINHLQVRTEQLEADIGKGMPKRRTREVSTTKGVAVDDEAPVNMPHMRIPSTGTNSPGGLGGWMPSWSFPTGMATTSASALAGSGPSHAEGSLRSLLRSTNSKN